ncbi:unnamed protein product [Gongylonema pulchrum]|uniref:Uncharacterized protein n=1 Tax=Gongylonema pulchrum TaxID=637853 RepID=A0A183D4Y3_9BILA|nr:unnamed protein product [Gongylonema pulchrum]
MLPKYAAATTTVVSLTTNQHQQQQHDSFYQQMSTYMIGVAGNETDRRVGTHFLWFLPFIKLRRQPICIILLLDPSPISESHSLSVLLNKMLTNGHGPTAPASLLPSSSSATSIADSVGTGTGDTGANLQQAFLQSLLAAAVATPSFPASGFFDANSVPRAPTNDLPPIAAASNDMFSAYMYFLANSQQTREAFGQLHNEFRQDRANAPNNQRLQRGTQEKKRVSIIFASILRYMMSSHTLMD